MQRLVTTCLAVTLAVAFASRAAGAPTSSSIPHYDHIFVIIEENHGFTDT